eukprot:7080713-Lingulodinium_polyedra.AAC.1
MRSSQSRRPAPRRSPRSEARASCRWILSGRRQAPATTKRQRAGWTTASLTGGTAPSTRT